MFFKNLLYGLLIGIGFIIPGVSGGVLATILGIYETILNKINNLFKNFKENFLYLLPLCIGIITSIFLFSKLILFLLNNKLNFISYVFIGLIIGCLPYLIKEIKNKSQKNISFLYFMISFIFGLMLFIIENNNITNTNTPTIFLMFIAGIMYSAGKLIPGISGAALLMLLGIYEYLLNIIANPFTINLEIFLSFIPFTISFVLSSIFIVKLMDYLLKNHFRHTYSAIIGFVISSILFIYPGSFTIFNFITLICSFLISYILSKK